MLIFSEIVQFDYLGHHWVFVESPGQTGMPIVSKSWIV